MNVAKPPGGFNVVLAQSVATFIGGLLANHPDLKVHWDAVVARLKAAGHTMGDPVGGNGSQRAAVVQPSLDGPRIKIAWRVLGDTVNVLQADL